jgi:hypothetical protein
VALVVLAAVAQVDPADVGDVEVGPSDVAQHDQLLVVATAHADPGVEQHLAPGLGQQFGELAVLRLAEL